MDYRKARASDADAIATLHADSWRENYRGAFPNAFLDGDLYADRFALWRERLEHPRENQLVQLAVDSANVVAFICAYADHHAEWGSLIDNLHVARSFKGKGFGRALMTQAAAWLSDRSPDHGVYLLVLEANVAAREFYERLGGHMAEITVEPLGGTLLRTCRFTWPSPTALWAPNETGRRRRSN
jgi:ribosomal protein S18 acetylase RimI-like enzyme